MRVFISWSGEASRSLADVLARWLPKVLQGVVPFVSAKDIDKGANWTVELSKELETTDFGIVCLAPDNLLSPWLNYEAGAITRSVDSRVCPVLLGVEKGDVKPPMAQLQMTSIDLEDFRLLLGSLSRAAGDLLSIDAVNEAVDVWWPRFQKEVARIEIPSTVPDRSVTAREPEQPKSSTDDVLMELLHRMRALERRIEVAYPSADPDLEQRQFSARRKQIFGVLHDHRLTPSRASTTRSGAVVYLDQALPSPLPDELRVRMSALSSEGPITIVGEDRRVRFSNGDTDDPPF